MAAASSGKLAANELKKMELFRFVNVERSEGEKIEWNRPTAEAAKRNYWTSGDNQVRALQLTSASHNANAKRRKMGKNRLLLHRLHWFPTFARMAASRGTEAWSQWMRREQSENLCVQLTQVGMSIRDCRHRLPVAAAATIVVAWHQVNWLSDYTLLSLYLKSELCFSVWFSFRIVLCGWLPEPSCSCMMWRSWHIGFPMVCQRTIELMRRKFLLSVKN